MKKKKKIIPPKMFAHFEMLYILSVRSDLN